MSEKQITNEELAAYVRDVLFGVRSTFVRLVELLDDKGALSKDEVIADLRAAIEFGNGGQPLQDLIPGQLAFPAGVIAVLEQREAFVGKKAN